MLFARMGALEHIEYTTVTGYFLQDDPGDFDLVSSHVTRSDFADITTDT
jgi:hypothetical protein